MQKCAGYQCVFQGEYRQAKEKHELLRRQGKLDPNVELVFDDDKTVEGELYRLGMKLDDLEHIVQNNVKISSQPRKPFQASLTKSPSHGVGVGVGVGVSSAAGECRHSRSPPPLPR